MFLPLIRKTRCCLSSSAEVTSRMPNEISLRVRHDAACIELEPEGIEVLGAELGGPPQARIGDPERPEGLRGEADHPRLAGVEAHGLLERHVFNAALQHALDGPAAGVGELGGHRELGPSAAGRFSREMT